MPTLGLSGQACSLGVLCNLTLDLRLQSQQGRNNTFIPGGHRRELQISMGFSLEDAP